MEEESIQAFFWQSTEFRWSKFVESRTKVHHLDEGYACVPKKERFHRISKGGDLEKSKFSGLGGVLETFYHSTTLQEVEIIPTLVYFHNLGCFKGGCLY